MFIRTIGLHLSISILSEHFSFLNSSENCTKDTLIYSRFQYLDQPVIKRYLGRVRAGAREVEVDHLWLQMLRLYFPLDHFGLEREAYISGTSTRRTNITVSVDDGRGQGTIVFVECKRPPRQAHHEPSPSTWTRGKGQLESYMLRWRGSAGPRGRRDLFGVVAIGRLARFFILRRSEAALEDLDADAKTFRIGTADGSAEVEAMLLAIFGDAMTNYAALV
ncbi:hypothetical protein ASPZODRAFT_564196 [Penicilliopsis zonata CBS 506.65]|uniref:Uncharacterized protein n=1 Tax=Penicilliopsis zonata CBS 506.65 TaxID=1073090 RepID=A0A1L9SDL5_9EURO|nr:hypothetical protein ASPZODRAFT_564196 [Penicilliopsis zonata CBS 506.65]OJJ45269.1 hypothetical protein ASPZODRAFT_564196 [Penicilliopsis zonata CBS 506.65]